MPTDLYDVTLAVVDALESAGIDHFIVGGLAVVYYGAGRTTYDADFVVQLEGKDLRLVMQELGPEFRLNPQKSFEARTAKSYRVMYVQNTPYKVELFSLSQEPFDLSQFTRRAAVLVAGRNIMMQTPEDLIVQKLLWQRKQDLADAAHLIAIRRKTLDWPYIHQWVGALRLNEVLAAVMQ
jgi:hypothetical protein